MQNLLWLILIGFFVVGWILEDSYDADNLNRLEQQKLELEKTVGDLKKEISNKEKEIMQIFSKIEENRQDIHRTTHTMRGLADEIFGGSLDLREGIKRYIHEVNRAFDNVSSKCGSTL